MTKYLNTETKYLNTDLDLFSPNDLTELVNALEAGGVSLLNPIEHEDGRWRANFDLYDPHDHPESTLTALLEVIESLDEKAAQDWRACSERIFDVGYDTGSTPWAFKQEISNATLRRIAGLGGSLKITLYGQVPAKSNRA